MSVFSIFKFIKDRLATVSDVSIQGSASPISCNVKKGCCYNSTQIPDLSLLIEKAFPSKNGLYPHEILMLSYATDYKIDLNDNYYQSFWCDKYGVTNPISILESLIKRGFIVNGGVRQTIEKFTISKLKEELKSIKEKTVGSRQDLIDRLLSMPEDILEQKYLVRYFQLTALGKNELQENQYVSYLHKNNFMSIWELNQMLHKEHKNYRDCIWEYFNKKSLEEASRYNFGIYSCIRFDMGRFLLEENKFKEALYFFCEVFKYDNSLLDNSAKYFLEEKDEQSFFIELNERVASFFEDIMQAPKLLKYFADIHKKMQVSELEFQSLLWDNFNRIKTEFCMFTNEELVKIIGYEQQHKSKELKSLYNSAKRREKSK